MQRRLNKMTRAYHTKVESLRKQDHTQQQVALMIADDEAELSELDMNISIAHSDALVRRARHLKVPIPSHSDKDAWDDFFGPTILTPKAYADLRSKIRQERKERRETVTAIVKDIISPLGALIISIMSLLIAYAALKLKH